MSELLAEASREGNASIQDPLVHPLRTVVGPLFHLLAVMQSFQPDIPIVLDVECQTQTGEAGAKIIDCCNC